jgi:RND family efflux transporter MFP subunit
MTRLPPKLVWPLAVLATAFLAAGGLVVARPDVEQVPAAIVHPTVRVLPAARESLQLSVHTQGTVVPRTETDLVSEVSGRVLWVSPSLASGGFVEPDEVLLRIDPSDYQIGVARAEAGLRRARSERSLAEAGLARHRRLADRGVESTSALEAAVNAREVAEATVIDAEATLEQARRDLQRTEIRSPYLGRVRDKRVDVGQFVGRGVQVARLYAVDYAEVRLPLPDADAAFLDLPIAYRDVSQQAPAPEVILSAEFAGRTHTWRGHIVRTEGELDPRTRMIHAVARIEDPYGRGDSPDRPPLSVGLFVQAEILGRVQDEVMRVPRSALRGDSTVVVVDAEGLIRLRDVEVLKRNRDEVLVVSGVEPGDRYCTTPLSIAVDGMRVETVEQAVAAADSSEWSARGAGSLRPGDMCPVHGSPCDLAGDGLAAHVAASALTGAQP